MDQVLQVDGAVANPLKLSVDDLRRAYESYTVETTYLNADRTVSTTFIGVRLWDVIESAQVKADPAHDPRLRIMARTQDGFRCLIRWHEFDPSVTNNLILIAFQQDGEWLTPDGGPLRLVVPGDEHGRRYLRGLAQLTVLTQSTDVTEVDDE